MSETTSITTHISSAPILKSTQIIIILALDTTHTGPHLLSVNLVQVVTQGQRHVAILNVCWGWCPSLGTRCTFWLTFHW